MSTEATQRPQLVVQLNAAVSGGREAAAACVRAKHCCKQEPRSGRSSCESKAATAGVKAKRCCERRPRIRRSLCECQALLCAQAAKTQIESGGVTGQSTIILYGYFVAKGPPR